METWQGIALFFVGFGGGMMSMLQICVHAGRNDKWGG